MESTSTVLTKGGGGIHKGRGTAWFKKLQKQHLLLLQHGCCPRRGGGGGDWITAVDYQPPTINSHPPTAHLSSEPGRSLTGKKKSVPEPVFPKKPAGTPCPQPWLVAVGGWRLAVGNWRLVVVGGGWWLVIGGWWRLAVVGSWRLVAAGGWQRLVAIGGWRLVAVGG